jgi:poly(3-hydroxybutyrate) depolymerase/thiol-disulfide isomerase/thioredoxin
MSVRIQRRGRRVVVAGAVVLSFVVAGWLLALWIVDLRRPPDLREFSAVRSEWDQAAIELSGAAKHRLAERSLEVGRKYPGTVGGLSALLLAATQAPDTSAGREAGQDFAGYPETADVALLAQAFDWGVVGRWKEMERFAPAILARAKQSPDHPRTGRLLAAVCAATHPPEGQEPPPVYVEAADLIADRYADSPDICHFCEGLGVLSSSSPPWAGRFERHLRAILRVNRDRAVRCEAQIALATVVQSAPEDRQGEAERLFEQFCAEFDGKQSYPFQGIERMLNSRAKDQLKELRFRAVGKPAPEIDGIDLDGRPIKVSDYRGRAVLLNFWGSWCFPCMQLIPHERELVARLAGQPFEIIGVNCDTDLGKAREAVARTGMTWRSFRDQTGKARKITGDWKVLGYPTLYLIDHHGIIRKRWIGAPSFDELLRLTRIVVGAASRKVAPEGMPRLLAAQPHSTAPVAAPVRAPASSTPVPGTGFLDKVHRSANGSESKYVLFVPRNYDRTASLPAILILHGAGKRGSDGRSHIQSGLAKAIRQRNEDFPFLVIFPQAREDEDWTAGSAGGQRALAILEQVQSDYRVDPDRIAVSGLSMGGAGTWSLAAAEPHRWSAIVPICHGWNPSGAARLKEVPCWCFHGDADRVIPAEQSRKMVRAIQEAGGRPLYHEFVGVDHNSCADRAYAMPELVEWLLLQNRAKR